MRRHLSSLAFLAVASVAVSARGSDSLFADRVLPDGVGQVGDFDGDGAPDRVVAGPGGTSLLFHRGDGHGSFAPAVSFATPSALLVRGAADVDGDGLMDVVASAGMPHQVVVAFGGPGGIAGFHVANVGSFLSVNGLAIADVTLDGNLDLCVRQSMTTSAVLVGNGAGGFAASPFATGTLLGPDEFSPGDVDLDGDPDLVVGLSTTVLAPAVGIATFFNQAGVGFVRADYNPGLTTGSNPSYFVDACSDFTGDGRADVLARVPSPAPARLVLLETTIFLAKQPMPTTSLLAPGTASVLATADLDADGKTDLLIGTTGGSARRGVMLAAPTATGFAAPVSASAEGCTGGRLADLDLDGKLDFVGELGGTIVDLDAAVVDPGVQYFTSSAGVSRAMTIADFDQDGDLDLLTANDVAKVLLLWAGDGAGGFAAPVAVSGYPPTTPAHIRAVSHNADAAPDLLVQEFNRVSVLWNNGSGSFSPAPIAAATASGSAFQFVAADLNGDGIADAVNEGANELHVSLGASVGILTGPVIPTQLPNLMDVAVGDVTGDGKPDLVTAERPANQLFPGSIGVYAGNGAGSFAFAFATPAPVRLSGIAVGDFDRDGIADVAAMSRYEARIAVYRSTGSALVPLQDLPIVQDSASTGFLVAEDLTGDGWLDLVTRHDQDSTMDAFIGHHGGMFDAGGRFVTATGSWDLEFGDFDGDAHVDFANVGILNTELEVHLAPHGALAAQAYGAGKAGSNGVPLLMGLGAPLLGGSSGLRIEHGLAGATPVMLIGTAAASIPFDLGALLVAPGGPIIALPPFPASATLDLPFALPSDPLLCGVAAYFQSLHVDPAAAGFLHTAQSNGLEWTLGM